MDTDRYLHARYGQPVRFDFDAIIVAIQKAGRTILYIGSQYRSMVRAAQKGASHIVSSVSNIDRATIPLTNACA